MVCQAAQLTKLSRYVLSCVVLISAAAAQGQANCSVTGFTFKQGHFPSQKGPGAVVGLFTLPYVPQVGVNGSGSMPPTPYPNLATTAAACQADPSCAMFTSNGYIIATYRASSGSPDEDAQVIQQGDAFGWKPLLFCKRRCCGTWVAEGALEQVLAPLPAGTPEGSSVQGLVRTVDGRSALPRDWGSWDYMNPQLNETACAGKEYQLPAEPAGLRSGHISAECPQRCRAACCKQLAEGDVLMSWHHFGQCAASVCRPCGFVQDLVATLGTFAAAAANSQSNVLMRQYLRAQAVAAVEAAGVSSSATSTPQQPVAIAQQAAAAAAAASSAPTAP